MIAQYENAVGANETVSGLSTGMGEMNLAMRRAQDKILHMLAHADAIDTLMASDLLSIPGEGLLTAQLQQITVEHNVDDELAEM